MADPRFTIMGAPKGSLLHNENQHNFADLNRGGGPAFRNRKVIPPVNKGGFGHQGRDRVHVRAGMAGARGGAGNPATRGGFRGEARGGNFQPETRVPGHGGSPQVREREQGNYGVRHGFGAQGQGRVNREAPGELPNYGPSNPKPGAGNTAGWAYKKIAGRFKRAAMGAKATGGEHGSYGSQPVTANT